MAKRMTGDREVTRPQEMKAVLTSYAEQQLERPDCEVEPTHVRYRQISRDSQISARS
jgi:hypothetical protein